MAKKKAAAEAKKKPTKPRDLNPTDQKTHDALLGLAETVVLAAEHQTDPTVAIPTRALSNVNYNPKHRLIELGGNKTNRQLFNMSSAKSYMQTLLVSSGVKQLVEEGKTTSIRGMFYLLKHTIEGTKEETFAEQGECDPIIEDLEVTLNRLREELHVYAKNAGSLAGPITLVDSGDVIDCSRMGSAGYNIPSICEPGIIDFRKCDAKYVLHVEKDTVWRRFNEDKFWKKNNCIVTHGGGQPARGVRRLLHRLHHELKLPIYCLLDNDPWGYYIYSVLKQGSINLAYESETHGDSRRQVPRPPLARFRPLRPLAQRADQT